MFTKYKAFVIISLIYSVFVFTGCTFNPVEVKQLNNISVKNISNNKILIEVTATINNPNRTIKIRDSRLFIYLNGSEIGQILQPDKVVLKGKATETYTTTVNLELKDLPGGIATAYKLMGSAKKDLKVSGIVKVSSLFYYKTIEIKDYQIFK